MSIYKNRPEIGIAVVQWNHVEHTLKLLKDLSDCGEDFRIAICDNGSDSVCREQLHDSVAALFPDLANVDNRAGPDWRVALLQNENNSGFAAGANVGIRALMEKGVDWIWLLNNDVGVEREAMTNLVSQLVQKPPGVYGTLIEEGGITQAGINRYNKWTTRYQSLQPDEARMALEKDDVYINGASMILHRAVVEGIGRLSEDTFLYFEELDYARRLVNSSCRQGMIADVTVQHAGAGSSGSSGFASRRMYHETWSTLAFYQKHHPVLFYAMLLLRTPARIAALVLRGRSSETGAVLQATGDFIKGINRDKKPVRIVRETYYS